MNIQSISLCIFKVRQAGWNEHLGRPVFGPQALCLTAPGPQECQCKHNMQMRILLILFALSSFKLFLELEPQIRDIIFKFYESKYASCLKLLDEMKVWAHGWKHVEMWLQMCLQPADRLSCLFAGQPTARHVPGPACEDTLLPDQKQSPNSGRTYDNGHNSLKF